MLAHALLHSLHAGLHRGQPGARGTRAGGRRRLQQGWESQEQHCPHAATTWPGAGVSELKHNQADCSRQKRWALERNPRTEACKQLTAARSRSRCGLPLPAPAHSPASACAAAAGGCAASRSGHMLHMSSNTCVGSLLCRLAHIVCWHSQLLHQQQYCNSRLCLTCRACPCAASGSALSAARSRATCRAARSREVVPSASCSASGGSWYGSSTCKPQAKNTRTGVHG